jgi:hypothetical protein
MDILAIKGTQTTTNIKGGKEMRLSNTSVKNLHICNRVGFDETDGGVLVWCEKSGNRAYLHTAEGPACFKSVETARAAVTRHRRRTAHRTEGLWLATMRAIFLGHYLRGRDVEKARELVLAEFPDATDARIFMASEYAD